MPPTLSFGRCRRAARSVRQAQYGRDAINTVRPRGATWLFRSRGPLALVLYVASHEGRLIWRGTGGLALLQPPAGHRLPASGGFRLAVLRVVERQWPMVLFCGPPLVLMLPILAVLALRDALGYGVAYAIVMTLLLAVVGYLAFVLVSFAVAGGYWFYRELGRRPPADDVIAAELLPGDHWAMTLCHEPGGVAPDELLRQASRRLVQLITAEVNRAASRLGAQAKSIDVIETLVCLRRGVTTQRMRDEVARWSQRPYASSEGWEVTMRFSGTRARIPSSRTNRAMDTGAFFFWYMLAVAVVVLVEAVFVAEWEQPQPGTACVSRPSTYGLALRWLAQRLLWTDPQGMSPATFQAWAVGWLTSLMSLVGLGVTVVAISQYRKYRSAKAAELERFIGATDRQTQVLLMVATAAERDAVLTAVSAANDTRPERRFLKDHTVFDLGQIGNAQILLAQCEQGAVGPGAAAIAAASLITRLEPDFLILTGICFGLRQDLQSLGDLVVCQQLRAIDHRKVADDEFVLVRGDHVSPSQTLLSRFRSAQVGWTKANVHFGPMLSSSVLVDSQGLRDDLLRLEPEAYGGEMEGAGVYAAASPGKVDWIVVKAICDWGHGKTDEWQELAARNAAEFVVHTIRTGALDDR